MCASTRPVRPNFRRDSSKLFYSDDNGPRRSPSSMTEDFERRFQKGGGLELRFLGREGDVVV